ncbi:capsule biosynthesis protein [Bordetella petrii]|uniref:Capsular polysaccharide biosynthesis protein n=1 Tax=Bordetella petrii (strain ATCC BAA-461 / DSM 12804 / CCUG 43448 / CIP 107267 / Se-1111R) TaxID=340100 RepID=A9IM15_BORPD|nr:capsular biosynthesis protein [Bordetella petrii]CAP42652.1 capsular polysaccharide biosynthesis protein [Bordetella petrii]
MSARNYLFLQGVCSPFFASLGRALRQHGHDVRKVNFTVGDRVYWGLGNTVSYRGPMRALPQFYADEYERHGTTDIVLFGDCRPVHQPAIALAKQMGIHVHVFEEGYFRPYWVTLERDGVNGNSALPRDPKWYREHARALPSYGNGEPFTASFWRRAVYDVGYNIWAGLNPVLHRGVSSHVPYNPAVEYLSYVRRGMRLQTRARRDASILQRIMTEAEKRPFFLFPLQINTDAQVRFHSPFSCVADALRYVVESFAAHAPQLCRLLVKAHPLDPGLVNYHKMIAALSKQLGLADRLFYIESGVLPPLLDRTRGVVTINSTTGASAILHGRSTIALGKAIYDMPGLTFQDPLQTFWREHYVPDNKLFSAFRNVVIHHTQLNGGFYSTDGIALATQHAVARLTGNA